MGTSELTAKRIKLIYFKYDLSYDNGMIHSTIQVISGKGCNSSWWMIYLISRQCRQDLWSFGALELWSFGALELWKF